MAEVADRPQFADRMIEPPTRTEWALVALMEAVGITGLLTGVLGPVWYILIPTVCFMAIHIGCVVARGRRHPKRQHNFGASDDR